MNIYKEGDYNSFRDFIRGWDQTRSLSEFKTMSFKTFGDSHHQYSFWISIKEGDRDISSFLFENFGYKIDPFVAVDYLQDDATTSMVEEFFKSIETLPISKADIFVRENSKLPGILSMLEHIRIDRLSLSFHSSVDRVHSLSLIKKALLTTSTETLRSISYLKPSKGPNEREYEIIEICDLIARCKYMDTIHIGAISNCLDSKEACSIIQTIAYLGYTPYVDIGCYRYDPSILKTLHHFVRTKGTNLSGHTSQKLHEERYIMLDTIEIAKVSVRLGKGVGSVDVGLIIGYCFEDNYGEPTHFYSFNLDDIMSLE